MLLIVPWVPSLPVFECLNKTSLTGMPIRNTSLPEPFWRKLEEKSGRDCQILDDIVLQEQPMLHVAAHL